eukprot:16452_1
MAMGIAVGCLCFTYCADDDDPKFTRRDMRWCGCVLLTMGSCIIAPLLIHIFIYVDSLNQAFAESSPMDCYIDDDWQFSYDWAYAGVWVGSLFFGLLAIAICPMYFCAVHMYVDTVISKIGREVVSWLEDDDSHDTTPRNQESDKPVGPVVLDLTFLNSDPPWQTQPANTQQNQQTETNTRTIHTIHTEQEYETNIIDTEQEYLKLVNDLNISDENNVKQYRELRTESAAIQTKASTLHSVALLPRNITTHTDQRCDLVNYQHMQGLQDALRSYHTQDDYDEKTKDSRQKPKTKAELSPLTSKRRPNINSVFNDNYTITSASEDFHHLLFHHDHQFEDIHDRLVKEPLSHRDQPCSLDDCSIAHDHYSEASVGSFADESAVRERVEQDILDKIHCYYLHSFDTGYRLRSSDRQKLLECEQKKDPQVDNEDALDRISTLRALEFVTDNNASRNLSRFERFKTRNNKYKSDIRELVHTYDDGIRYLYWEYYKDNAEVHDVALRRGDVNQDSLKGFRAANEGYAVKDWYIQTKYDDLKDELLNNENDPGSIVLLRLNSILSLYSLYTTYIFAAAVIL